MSRFRLSLLAALAVLPAIAALSAPKAPAAGSSRIVAADNQFAFRLFHQIVGASPNTNTFLSPFSAAEALAMTSVGAGSATRTGMAQALGTGGMDPTAIDSSCAALRHALQTSGAQVQLDVANDLWADRRMQFRPAYVQEAQQAFGAGVSTLDFGSPSAAATINRRISQETKGKITDLLTSPDLTPSGAVLTNAVYFHGSWTDPFDADETKPQSFNLASGKQAVLPMMHRSAQMSYFETPAFQAVQLPYSDGRFQMTVFLPKASVGLRALVARLNQSVWKSYADQWEETEVNLTLPRFHLATTMDLKPPLQKLGMADAFSKHADFSPMSQTPLYISGVRQKALLDVDEHGTTAAAATSVIMKPKAILMRRPPVIMNVDRPFLCAITDNQTGLILFLGAITDPR